jgi:hypothetical protein
MQFHTTSVHVAESFCDWLNDCDYTVCDKSAIGSDTYVWTITPNYSTYGDITYEDVNQMLHDKNKDSMGCMQDIINTIKII